MDNKIKTGRDDGIPPLPEKKKYFYIIVIISIFIAFLFARSIFGEKDKENSEQEIPPLTLLSEEENISIAPPKREELSWMEPEKSQEQKKLPEIPELNILEAQIAAEKEALAKKIHDRINSPIMIINDSSSNGIQGESDDTVAATNTRSQDPNTAFRNDLSKRESSTTNAKHVGALNTLILEGTLIHATMETAINSDLPGQLRAVVTYPVYAADGSQVLIPPASRVIAEYKSGLVDGQTRIFVIATRLITPDGVSIPLNSGVSSPLGVAGIGADTIDRYFIERFGQATLLALIGAGVANVGVDPSDEYNSAAFYRQEVASSFSVAANDALDDTLPRGPTLYVNQGKSITLFVASDITFKDIFSEKLKNQNGMIFK